ncbi:PREDICTED: peroxisome proliferator-activated receptor gamma coactivator 1-beta [Nanorana parkeri]|uniref:peroxisome proliferator-activated receptor gamma coactivator 1-beta n=1 Tax=Nanorana parkeri TaxID=125878 RepID=UPI0008546969|nr:PREDICTED: peroxisome proliferator-activated receptor gamma coactivator 1-beta [Nanorana parkeri]
MADCSTLLDEDLESFVFNYLTDSPEPGEEPLSLDFPEIDLSQLDAGDFDTNSCFNELQWCTDQSENESSQYSTDDSELFQIIYGDNEALLEALTQTLDDEISLSAFMSSGDGDFCPAPALSPKSCLPSESFKGLETEDELSILKKLLLSPAQTPTGSDTHNDSSCRQTGITKLRPHRQCLKVESPVERQSGVPQMHLRGCTELQRHLVSPANVPSSSAKDDSLDSNQEAESDTAEEDQSGDESGSFTPLPALQSQEPQFTCEREKQAVVDLIRYMHTYCLPPKKHHSDEKHQHCTGLPKRSKTNTNPSVHSCSNRVIKVNSANAKGKCYAQGKYKKTKPTRTESSILKVLLAKDICGDVSKPYRLAQPVYAAFTDSSCSHPLLSIRRESRCMEADTERPAHNAPEQVTNKSAFKQECSVYAVRRSSRLNPEFWFNDEVSPQTCTAQAGMNAQITTERSHCLTTEPFVDEEQVAEVEVEESIETTGRVEGDRTLQDMLEMDAREAHSDLVKEGCHTLGGTRCSTVSLSQTTSAFEKRHFDQGISVELCGTAGLTPPTTPPYKPAEEDLYKPEISQGSANSDPSITSPVKTGETEKRLFVNRRLSRKQPERTELFAHLSKTSSVPVNPPQGIKRPFSRFGDHDYCQVKKSEPAFQRKVIKSVDRSGYCDRKHIVPPVLERKMSSEREDSKQLKDHEIRASLTKHFGSPDNTLKEEEDNVTCTSPEYDSAFEDSESECNSPEDDICLSPLRKKSYNHRNPTSKLQSYPRNQATTQIIRTPDNRRSQSKQEISEHRQTGHWNQRQLQRKREQVIDEGWVIVIRNLSNSINAHELKKRFEVFGEILECRVLSKSRGEKYGFITYRRSEHAAMSLKKGPSLRKKNEPLFHMSYEGSRHVFWTKYRHLDSSAEEPSSMKYKPMDFDNLRR